MNVPKIDDLKQIHFSKSSIQKYYPEFYEYLLERYKNIYWNKFSELLYLYFHNMNDTPKCPVCGNQTNFICFSKGYHTYCKSCVYLSNDVKNKRKQSCLEKYGVDNPSKSDIIKKKKIQTSLKHYGVEHITQSEEIKQNIQKTCLEKYGGSPLHSDTVKNKFRKTCLEKYGVDNPSKSDIIKKKKIQTSLKHYGVEVYSQSNEYKEILDKIMEKSNSTKRKNNSFHESNTEKKFKQWLDDNNIEYKYQYKNDKYPFNCDFYFPNKDLYLEIQGFWMHNQEPYDETNPKHQEILNTWKQKSLIHKAHAHAIYIWTVRDPMKRKWAYEHNLNWQEVFTHDINTLIDKVKDIL